MCQLQQRLQAFSYYDSTCAVINAHLPATVYTGSAERSQLEERDRHIASMIHQMRIGACHPLWDAHVQFHHSTLYALLLLYSARAKPHYRLFGSFNIIPASYI